MIRLSLSARLVLSYLALILIGMALVGPLAWLAMEQLYLNTQRASLLAQAELVASALVPVDPAPGPALPYSQLSNAQPGIHTRVLDAQGAVLIDLAGARSPAGAGLALPQLAQNAAGLVTADELISRPEIVQALQGQSATAVRQVPAAGGRQVLYAAAPVRAGGAVVQIVYLATPLPDTQLSALPDSLRWQFAGVMLAALGLAGAAGLLLARRIARPLSQLAEASRAVAGGDLQQRVPEDPAIHELAVLGGAFNAMTAALRRADQAKAAFVSDVSHELRTPLTVIKGTIETLQDGAIDDLPARERFLAAMSRETERLVRLVNDLLVLTRADAGALNLRPERLNLAELAHARCAGLERAAAQRGVRLRVQAEPECGWVQADADRLAQVLDNLLDNALRYSPSGGEVTVSIRLEDGKVVCRVSDGGPGIPAEHLSMIFERFYRADPARGRAGSEGGSGLGLAIVRSLLAAQGGQIEAANAASGGAVLTFRLPLAAD